MGRAKILVMGLPGSGKTTLSAALAKRFRAVHFNADDVRRNLNRELSFSLPDRIEHARRMGWLCDQVVLAGHYAIGDFVCPTPRARAAFGQSFVVWMDRIKVSRYADTDAIFVPPKDFQARVTAHGTVQYWVDLIEQQINNQHTE